MTKKKRITVRVNEALWETVEYVAFKGHVSINAVVAEALVEYFTKRGEPIKTVKEMLLEHEGMVEAMLEAGGYASNNT